MTAYAAVTIVPLAEDGMWRPGWVQEPNMQVRHIPYANKDDIQGAGRGNFRLELDVLIEDDTGVSTLQAAVGTTARTLSSLFGSDYSNTYLLGVSNVRRWDYGAKWRCTISFMREGS